MLTVTVLSAVNSSGHAYLAGAGGSGSDIDRWGGGGGSDNIDRWGRGGGYLITGEVGGGGVR